MGSFLFIRSTTRGGRYALRKQIQLLISPLRLHLSRALIGIRKINLWPRENNMKIVANTLIVIAYLLLIPFTAISTAAAKQRFSDGPNRVFSGGPLVAGEFYIGAEPDWSFVNSIPTIEMQLLDPPTSRRIWTVEHEGKIYVWSGYMGSTVGRLWKRWPIQAERNGLAILRVNGKRYERNLIRIQSGDELDGITEAISAKYPGQTTRQVVEQGDVWLFEVAARTR